MGAPRGARGGVRGGLGGSRLGDRTSSNFERSQPRLSVSEETGQCTISKLFKIRQFLILIFLVAFSSVAYGFNFNFMIKK